MPLADLPGIGQEADLPQVKDYLIGLRRMLNDFLNHLDTLNVDELDANVILARTITADKIVAGAITAVEIAAHTITADKMIVTQLSAIAADLGTITAGIIYGAYIATANGTYPRSEMSTVLNLFGAYLDANNSITIVPNYSGLPGLLVTRAGVVIGRIWSGTTGRFNITGTTDLYLEASNGAVHLGGFGGVGVTDWASFFNETSAQNLQAALDAKANKSAISKTVYVAATSGAAATTPMVITNGVITG